MWGDGLEALSNAQLDEAEALLFGRKTYEGMAAYWAAETGQIADGMNAIRNYVVSTTLSDPKWNNSHLISGDAIAAIADLRRNAKRNIYIFGSADLLATLLPTGLIDEYRIGIAPLLLGRGTPLFKPSDHRIDLALTKTQPLASGGIILFYDVKPPT